MPADLNLEICMFSEQLYKFIQFRFALRFQVPFVDIEKNILQLNHAACIHGLKGNVKLEGFAKICFLSYQAEIVTVKQETFFADINKIVFVCSKRYQESSILLRIGPGDALL